MVCVKLSFGSIFDTVTKVFKTNKMCLLSLRIITKTTNTYFMFLIKSKS